jgi:hypothetical protein
MARRTGFDELLEDLHAQQARLRQQLIANVHDEVLKLPLDMFEGELPTYRRLLRRIGVFPLGEYRRIQLDGIMGRTTLYVGENYQLYEYGPEHVEAPGWDVVAVKIVLALRPLRVDALDIDDLLLARDLLRQVWLVC